RHGDGAVEVQRVRVVQVDVLAAVFAFGVGVIGPAEVAAPADVTAHGGGAHVGADDLVRGGVHDVARGLVHVEHGGVAVRGVEHGGGIGQARRRVVAPVHADLLRGAVALDGI